DSAQPKRVNLVNQAKSAFLPRCPHALAGRMIVARYRPAPRDRAARRAVHCPPTPIINVRDQHGLGPAGAPTSAAGGFARLLVGLRPIHRGGSAVLLLFDLETNLLAFAETSQARLLHGADMDEDILSAGIWRNEAVAFGWIEPLYGALGHRRAAFLPVGLPPT